MGADGGIGCSLRIHRHRESGPARRRTLAATRGVALAALLLAMGFAAPSRATVVCPGDWEREVATRINQQRAAVGLVPLAVDVRLVAASRRHSQDMADNGVLSHTGSDGSTPRTRMLEAGYPTPSGETAGAGHYTPAMIVDGWMNSSGHRAILLDPGNRHVGVGYVGNPQATSFLYRHLWTAAFGRSADPAQTPEQFCGPPTACNDGIDNDGDGLTDYPLDTGCYSAEGFVEGPPCKDGIDNDGDGRIDFPADPECLSPDQLSERDPACGIGFELVFLLPPLAAWRARRRASGRAAPASPA